MATTLRGQRIKELVKIGGAFVAVLLLSVSVTRILTEAWELQNGVYHLVRGSAYELGNTDVLFIVPISIYLGLLTLVILDRMKRVQGLLLAAGTLVGGIWLWMDGQLWANVDWIGNIHILFIGYGVGLLLGGGQKLYTDDWPFEFKNAIRLLFVFISLLVVAALLEIHLVYENAVASSTSGLVIGLFDPTTLGLEFTGAVTNLALSGMFVGILYVFTSYEYRQSFMVLGPKRGGKTTLMTGAFHTADNMTAENANASENLIEYRNELLGSTPGFGNVDEPTPPGEVNYLRIKYNHGQLLKKRVELEAIDHGGEVLPDLYEEVTKVKEYTPWAWLQRFDVASNFIERVGGVPADAFRGEAHRQVAESVDDADCLIITIPVDDFVADEIPDERLPEYFQDPQENRVRPPPAKYLAEYDKLLNLYEEADEDKEVLVVATMTDLVIDEFKQQRFPADEPLSSERDYQELDRWITDELLGPRAERILNYSDTDSVVSVHFKMNPNENAGSPQDPEPNPVLADGRVEFVSGERLLRNLGE